MKELSLPKKTLLLWRLRAVFVTVAFLFICYYFLKRFSYFYVLALLITGVLAALVFWYLPKLFQSCKIRFFNEGIIIIRGVIFKTTHILPFSRLIYTQTTVTPLARLLGLMAVSLKAARSRLFVPELKKNDAEFMLTMIVKQSAKKE